jgi:predicted dehydrogenase
MPEIPSKPESVSGLKNILNSNNMKHFSYLSIISLFLFCVSCTTKTGQNTASPDEIRLITLDPGHFHAALVQKTSYPQVSNEVYVYAPEGDDLQEHLKKIEAYNTRSELPTQWNEIIYTGPDYLDKMLQEKKGNVVVLAGNNGKKTGYIQSSVSAGLHVLADKPMAIRVADFEQLQECFKIAEQNGVLLYDIMTERFEITTKLQKAFSQLPAVYGEQQKGTPDEPAITKESVHHFFKTVSGNPLKRPAWFFDTEQQGEGMVDVTTHLVDLVQWACFPNQIIDYRTDIELLDANHWTTPVSSAQFTEATGETTYPDYLQKDVRNDTLFVYSNGNISYKIKGVHAKVSVIWNYTYPEGGGDTHYSVMKGSKAQLVIEQGKEQNYKPVLSIKAVPGTDLDAYEKDLSASLATITDKYPGVSLRKLSSGIWQVEVPASYHNGHEAHFGQVTENFLQYVKEGALPEWEVPNMLTKYYITTQALELAFYSRNNQ